MSRSILIRTGIAGAAAAALLFSAAAPATAQNAEVAEPDSFTSAFTAMATPDQPVDMEGNPAPGVEGASATADFRINSDEEIICFDITTEGQENFSSPANTATHIHEAPAGQAGPPRVVFPNPNSGEGTLTSSGCIQGPFETGVEPADDGVDAGEGFTLAEIEADPTGYYFDTHTEGGFEATGTVRGQLQQVPVEGVDTGAGGTAAGSSSSGVPVAPLGLGALALAGLAGAFAHRRATAETR
jgi:hypothetical protein